MKTLHSEGCVRRHATVVMAMWMIAALGAGCGGARPQHLQEPRPVMDPDFISLAEIRRSGEATAYDVVETLRPLWFHKRGPQRFIDEGDVLVYLGDAQLGRREVLREIAASAVASMQFLDAGKASYRYGMNHPYGAIIVSTVFPPGQ
ncbi:MAG TPA: hypothetical protein VG432_07775 [Gemmatimonadaceae bacterium]|nr:hypothetical protein [Gemmatimonadaceae bacterium]